ncbi:putative invertase inhibitor [Spatholobus suberectus]|nr:putative invertase inhibitor [Spatholobus suberectus]
MPHPPPTNLEDLVGMSIQLTKSNRTNMVSIVSKLLKNKSFDQYIKSCLQSCFDLYSFSFSTLDGAVVAFKSKDFDTTRVKVSGGLACPITCEDQFNNKKVETSPLKKENRMYF